MRRGAVLTHGQTERQVRRDALGVGVAVGVSGLSFGAAATSAGLSVSQASALSALVFTGGSQFALVGVLGAGGGVVAGVAAALLLGSRNLLYAVRLAALVPQQGWRRLVAAQVTIDESTAVATGVDRAFASTGFWWTGLSVFALWNLSTLAGALGAAAVDTHALGLDAGVAAAFLALLWPRLRDAGPVALGGALLALVAVPLTPPGVPILVAALAVLPALRR